MNETTVTLQGNVGGTVSLRAAGDTVVAGFRVACTPRRYSRRSGTWSDGPTQWYSVSAWRALGEHCAASLNTGDPVVVHGRIDMRSYQTKDGTEATDVAVDAVFVGHDLSRGTTVFTKAVRPETAEPPAPPAASAASDSGVEEDAGAGAAA